MTCFPLTESAPGQGEGRLNPRTYWDPGPVWAFVCKIEKLNTKSPPAADCSSTPRNCDLNVAMLNRFESLPRISIESASLLATCPGAECGNTVAKMIQSDSPQSVFRMGWTTTHCRRGRGFKSLAPLRVVTASGSPKDFRGFQR